jgi:hypothetical protein
MNDLLIRLIQEFYSSFDVKYKIHDEYSLILQRYFAFRLKYIDIGVRNARISKELSAKLNTHQYRDICFDIFERNYLGKDVNPYQGKQLLNADFHDYMFNDWGIHHLHLSSFGNKNSHYFVNRSDYLLFVRFTDTTAYFLDIYLHKEKHIFGKKALIKIIHDNWPDTIKSYRRSRFYPDFSDEEVQTIRNKGYSFGINVTEDTGYLMLGHGYAASGDNMMAGRIADELHRWMHKNEILYDTNPQQFEQDLRKQLYLY